MSCSLRSVKGFALPLSPPARLVPIVRRTRRDNENGLVPIFHPPVFPLLRALSARRRIRRQRWVFHQFCKRAQDKTGASLCPGKRYSACLLCGFLWLLPWLVRGSDGHHARFKVLLRILTHSIRASQAIDEN